MQGLHSLVLVLLWTAVHAVTVTRICQNTGKYAPQLRDCQGYKDAINQKYSDGLIVQTNVYASCQVVYQYQSCNIDVCAFPDQGLNTSALFATVDDLLNNCQSTGSSYTFTGGYNIIQNTNITVGVLGTTTPYQTKVTTSDSSSPLSSDCQSAVQSISLNQNYTQSDTSNCTIVAKFGSCQFSYCDVQGSQMSGTELQSYVSNLYLIAAQGSSSLRSSGFTQISQDKRVAVFSTGKTGQATQTEVHCRSYYDGSPKSRDCDAAYAAISKANPFGWIQNQTNAECTTIGTSGACQIDLCGPTGSSLATANIKQALSQINSTCLDSSGAIGGYARVANTNSTLSVSTTNIPQNIWCNTSPNNSPEYTDCGDVLDSIQANQLYQQVEPIGCTLLKGAGKCKLNFCAPQGDTISGRDLQSAATSIIGSCFSGNYASGIYQINPSTSVGIYDPPTMISSAGFPLCETTSKSPTYKDCIAAVSQLIFTNPGNTCTNTAHKGPSSCTSVSTVGSCQIQICGQGNQPYSCGSIGTYANWIIRNCTDGTLIGGELGIRNAFYMDSLVQVINSGQPASRRSRDLSFRFRRSPEDIENQASVVTSSDLVVRKPNLPNGINIQGTNLYFIATVPAFYAAISTVSANTKRSLTVLSKGAITAGAATMEAVTTITGYSEGWRFFASKHGPYNENVDLPTKLVQGNAAGGGSTLTTAPDLISAVCSFMQDQMGNVFNDPSKANFGMSPDRFEGQIVDYQSNPLMEASLGLGFNG